jgi:hypothetical protein
LRELRARLHVARALDHIACANCASASFQVAGDWYARLQRLRPRRPGARRASARALELLT